MIKLKIKLVQILTGGLMCIGLFLIQNVSAQEATLSKTLEIRLDENSDLVEHYTMNADQFNFETQVQAMNYFKDVNADFVAIRPMVEQGVVHLYLQRKKKPEWDIEDWNNYLSKILEHKLTTDATITK